MKVKSKYESPLVLNKMEIVEGIFRKKDKTIDSLELGVQVEPTFKSREDGTFEILLETTVTDENETVYVNVKGRAIFFAKFENIDTFKKNMIAIMFPYIRSYISIITTQPGMDPIVLPAMNIVAMINDSLK